MNRITSILALTIVLSCCFSFYVWFSSTPSMRLKHQQKQLARIRDYKLPFLNFGGEWATCSEQQLLDWGSKNGIEHEKIELGTFKFELASNMAEHWVDRIAERRGMRAKHPIKEGEVILKMPFSTLISVHTAESIKSLQRMFAEEGENLDDLDKIILFVLFEMRNEHSKWASVICKFPRTYENALYWNKDDLRRIRDSIENREEVRKIDYEFLKNMALNFRYQVVHMYNTFFPRLSDLYPEAFPYGMPPLEEFVWAACSVFSRNWMVTKQNEHHNIMGPVADMVNHRSDDYGYIDSDSDGNFVMFAGRNYRAGEEVFTNYGPKCNEELLVNYGFSDIMNTVDCSAWQHKRHRNATAIATTEETTKEKTIE